MTQPESPTARKLAVPEETPEWTAEEVIKQHGRVIGKRLLREREPTVSVFIQPTEEDNQQAEALDGAYPPTWLMLDGTRYSIKVGEENTLPQSVWEAYKVSKKMARVRVPGVFTRQMGEELPSPR
jgi:hypothetical protein